eukprot:TRINITY_DN72241_c0_g1_i1.p1 TRINITY_DN72241_c0_g1~~TRINITY_DN72241_c0_g1_i1.p1  ORF type:complete len:522 (+),score=35.35 TRINITY_DN72241_c0_g1_i1:168-1568(+)
MPLWILPAGPLAADPTSAAAAVYPPWASAAPPRQAAVRPVHPAVTYVRKEERRQQHPKEYSEDGTDFYVKWIPFKVTSHWLLEKLDEGGFPVARDTRQIPLLSVWRSAKPGHVPKAGTARCIPRVQAKVRIQGRNVDERAVRRFLSTVCKCEVRVHKSRQLGWREPEVRAGVHLRFYWSESAVQEGKCVPIRGVEDVLKQMAGRIDPSTGKHFLGALRGLVCLCITTSKHSEQPGVGRIELAGEFSAGPRYTGMPQEQWERLSKLERDNQALTLAENCHEKLNEMNIGWYIVCVDYSDGVTQFGRLEPNGHELTRDSIVNRVQKWLRDLKADWLTAPAEAYAVSGGAMPPGQLQHQPGMVSTAGWACSPGPAGPAGSTPADPVGITGSGSIEASETTAPFLASPRSSPQTVCDAGAESLIPVDAADTTEATSPATSSACPTLVEAAVAAFDDCCTPRRARHASSAW